MYAGVRYWLEDYKINETEPGKQLSSGAIPGIKNNFISGIGPVFNFDSRDNIFYPSKGLFIDAGVQLYGSGTGSNYRYNRYTADASFSYQIKERMFMLLICLVIFWRVMKSHLIN